MSRNSQRAPTEGDERIGQAVRRRRMILGMSQEKLGSALGVTYQQVQKYEKASNRISAERLARIAEALNTTVPALLDAAGDDGASSPSDGADRGSSIVDAREELSLLRAYRSIKDPLVRRRLRQLAQALGEPEGIVFEPE